MERWKKRAIYIKKTIKETRQFDYREPEELELELDNFDVDNSYPTSPSKGRNIVHLDFVYKQLLDGCKTTLSLTQCHREKLIDLPSILYLSCQKYSTVTMVKTSTWNLIENIHRMYTQDACIYDVNTKRSQDTCTKFLL